MKKVILSIFAILVLFVLYGLFLNPQQLALKEYSITNAKITDGFDGFKIAHFSDLLIGSTQTSENLEKIVQKINEMEVDIIVFTGDLINRDYIPTDEEKAKIKDLLLSLDCTLYKYAVIGDNDESNLSLYKEIMNEANFQVLDNESTYLFYKDVNPIEIVGLTNLDNPDTLYKEEEGITPSYRIVLSHFPDYADELNNNEVDLMIAGHSLGGQVRLPFIGGLIKKDGARKYIDGLYEVGNMRLYVSRGLGTEYYGFRTFNTPTIYKYRLFKG